MKNLFTFPVICIISMVCMISCSNNNPTKVKDEPAGSSYSHQQPVEKKQSEIGTYTFSDSFQYQLTLNDDGTAVLNSTQKDHQKILKDYGSWEVSSNSSSIWGNPIIVHCSGDLYINLPDGSYVRTFNIYLQDDGYVYFGATELKAKNPKKRLAYTKR